MTLCTAPNSVFCTASEILQSKSIRDDLRRLGIRRGIQQTWKCSCRSDSVGGDASQMQEICSFCTTPPRLAIRSVANDQPLLLRSGPGDPLRVSLQGAQGVGEVLIDRGGGLVSGHGRQPELQDRRIAVHTHRLTSYRSSPVATSSLKLTRCG